MSALGRLAAAGALALVLGACSSDNQVDRNEPRTPPAKVNDTDRPTTPSDEMTSAPFDPAHPDFPDPLIKLDDLLIPVERLDTFWIAWAAFQPETRLVAAS